MYVTVDTIHIKVKPNLLWGQYLVETSKLIEDLLVINCQNSLGDLFIQLSYLFMCEAKLNILKTILTVPVSFTA